jgi:hypothetical protein
VDVVVPLVAHRKPATLAQPGQRTLHHPPVPSQLLTRVHPAAGDAWGYTPLPQGLAAAGEVVGFVSVQLLRALARPTEFSTRSLDRLDAIHSLFQHLRVMDVAALRLLRAGGLLGLPQHGASSPLSPCLCRIRVGSLTPFSWHARRVQRSPLPIYPIGLAQAVQQHPMQLFPHACHLPVAQAPPAARTRSAAYLLGSISQGVPLFKTKTMPARAARSSMRGLPPLGFGGTSGNNGSMISQSSSETSSLLMATSVTPIHKQVLQESLRG